MVPDGTGFGTLDRFYAHIHLWPKRLVRVFSNDCSRDIVAADVQILMPIESTSATSGVIEAVGAATFKGKTSPLNRVFL